MRLKNLLIVCCLAFLLCIPIEGYAGTWRDDFEDGNLDGWAEQSLCRVHWQSKDGTLQIDFFGRIPGLPLNESVALFWVELPPEQAEFTVACDILDERVRIWGVTQHVGLLVGGVPSDVRIEEPWHSKSHMYYAFFTNGIWLSTFQINLSHGGTWENVIEYNRLKQLTVSFKAGRFQLSSAGQVIHEFEDAAFQRVHRVAIWALAYDMTAALDNFVISGPKIPGSNGGVAVQPKGRLATTWGTMKQ